MDKTQKKSQNKSFIHSKYGARKLHQGRDKRRVEVWKKSIHQLETTMSNSHKFYNEYFMFIFPICYNEPQFQLNKKLAVQPEQ